MPNFKSFFTSLLEEMRSKKSFRAQCHLEKIKNCNLSEFAITTV